HAGVSLPSNFRSPSSIQRKTYDLATADESYAGTPTRGGRRDAAIIAAFRADTDGMQARATAIRNALARGETLSSITADDGDEGAREGGILESIARRRERSRTLRQRKIRAVVASGGVVA